MIEHALSTPFPALLVEASPGDINADRTKATARLSVPISAYQDRLDSVVGLDHWTVRYEQGPHGVAAHLHINDMVKSGIGDYPTTGTHKATRAADAAFQQACSQFGLGRYLSDLPRHWFTFDSEQACFVDPMAVVRQTYVYAGLPLDDQLAPTTTIDAAMPNLTPNAATEDQARRIAFLVLDHHRKNQTAHIRRVGDTFMLPTLTECKHRNRVLELAMNAKQASLLIDALQAAP